MLRRVRCSFVPSEVITVTDDDGLVNQVVCPFITPHTGCCNVRARPSSYDDHDWETEAPNTIDGVPNQTCHFLMA